MTVLVARIACIVSEFQLNYLDVKWKNVCVEKANSLNAISVVFVLVFLRLLRGKLNKKRISR